MLDHQNVAEENPDIKNGAEEILRIARERYALADEAWSEVYEEGLHDLEYVAGEQWDEGVKNQRKLDRRPVFTVNRLPQFIRQVANDQRQNRPSIKVSPVDDQADVETAKILQGIIKNIENSSNAAAAYDRAFECALSNSFGFYRIRPEYVSPTSFDQELRIDQIPDPFLVKVDPFFREPDGSDMNWGFIECDYSKDDYKKEFGDSELSKESDWKSLAQESEGWVTANSVRVCEYYCKEYKEVTLVQLTDGQVVDKETFSSFEPKQYLDEQGLLVQEPAPQIVNERKTRIPLIKQYKLNGSEILEETELPGSYIPILPVLGNEIILKGKRKIESLIRHAKDSQSLHNYWISSEAEAIALAPKAPYIAAEGQIPPEYREQWRTANEKNHAVLLYKPTSVANTLIGPPQRNAYEPAVQAITNARMQSSEDMKATTGIYDAALGSRSNETSGVAIQRRNHQAQTSNFHFIDNLSRTIRHGGRILIELIPYYYDSERALKIIGEEGDEKVVFVNKIFEEHGKEVKYDLSLGKYDVAVETGPSFATKRQEASDYMIQFIQAYPQAAPLIGDLIAKAQDWPGATEIAERLKKTLPPGIAEEDKDKPQIPPEIQQQMMQMDQEIQSLQSELGQAAEALRIKKYELDSKERIEVMKLENQAAIELAKLESKEAIEALFAQMKELDFRTKQLMGKSQLQSEDEINQQDFNFNGSGDEFAANPQEEQQPTGGIPPGNYIGE